LQLLLLPIWSAPILVPILAVVFALTGLYTGLFYILEVLSNSWG
jgi:hypothetical protein